VTRRPPIAGWPARDRALWEKGVETRGLFESDGAGAGWSEGSRYKTAVGYNAWLSWLVAKNLLDPDLSPADRVTRERVAEYIAELQAERAAYTVLCRVQELYDALRVVSPETNWDWLAQLYRTLRPQVRPTRDKVSRLRPIDELAALGERLMEEAETAPDWSARRQAVLFRDGLMIALLAYRPLRLRNFAMMRLGRHLTKVSGCWQILFAADETKSHVPYEAIVPSALARGLERYLDVHRLVLMRGERADGRADAPPINRGLDAVWVSEVGTQLEASALGRRIVDRTRDTFGRSVCPHMFRDCAATSIAVDNPKHIGDASLVLGHAGHTMTEKHYSHARSFEASRRHAEGLVRLRETLNAGRRG
jgi:integrase/recombinase XerD